MVKQDQDFVDPLEYLTEEDLKLLEDIANESRVDIIKMPDNEKLDHIVSWMLSVSSNPEFVAIMKAIVTVLDEIDYNEYQDITKKLDDIYWEYNYEDFSSGYADNDQLTPSMRDDTQLGKLFSDDKYLDEMDDIERIKYYEAKYIEDKKNKTGTIIKRRKVKTYTTPVQPDFLPLNKTSYPLDIKFSLSPLATAKLFIMMKFYQSVEWGSYMKLDKALPKLEDLYKAGEWEIEVLDFILIPQVRSMSHIEYLENELPEYMDEWKEAKLAKYYVNSGRIHSHHTMGSWHSGTDTGEFKMAYQTEDRMFSVVTAFSDKVKKIDQNKDLDDWDYYFKALSFDAVLFIPLIGDQKNQVKANFGYTIRESLWLNPYGIDEIKEAVKWRLKFEQMDIFVNQKYPLIEKLLQLQVDKKIDEVNFYNIRSMIIEDKELFTFVSSLIDTLSVSNSEKNAQLKYKTRMDEIKKIVERK